MAAVEAVEVMDGAVVRRWFSLAADALGRARLAIDALNVFPVPDADTGTNLHRTMVCAADAVAGLPPQAGHDEIWRAAVSGALLGACGNSGIIVSQLLRGLGDTCGPASPCDGRVVARALANAAALARAAVQRPAEGTLLTVADAAARAAGRMTSLAEVASEAAVGARLALARTELQLEVLAACGVVDAGAAGLCVVLDALSAAISGTAPGGYAVPEAARGRGVSAARLAAASLAAAGAPDSPNSYEVTFLLEAARPQVQELRDRLDRLGDSLVVSGGEPRWHVHVHVADAGAVIEAGLLAGRPSRITVTYLNGPGTASPDAANQEQEAAGGAASAPGLPVGPTGPQAGGHRVLTVAEGAGLIRLLREAGAIVVDCRDGAEAGSGLPEAFRSADPKIIIMPNESPLALADRAADRPDARGCAGSPVTEQPAIDEQVIEIGCAVQALAALAVHDPQRDLRDDAAAMRRAVTGMRHASVSRRPARPLSPKAREPASAGGAGEPDDRATFAGRIGGVEVAQGTDQATVAIAVIDRLLAPGAELVTLLSGLAADPGLVELAAAHVRRATPAAEVACYDGGMASAVLLIGAE